MKNSRSKNAKLNVITGLFQEAITVICGLILPRIILVYYGSTYNGIVNSITQFLGFTIVLRSGLGAVTNAALYKPLADGNDAKVSAIMVATHSFMSKVGYLLIALILGFSALFPLVVSSEFNYWFSFFLVVIVGMSSFVENMFSIKYKILLQADQKYYIQTIFGVIAQILSTALSILFIMLGFGIHMVKLVAVLGLMTTPFMLKFYVDKKYKIDWKARPDNIAISSRWDAFAQQLATIINSNVDTIIMTFLVPLKEISVYSVYFMVLNNLTKLFYSSMNGIKSVFGNMLAMGEIDILRKRFEDIEWIVFTVSSIIFITAAIMITPFVLLYTQNVTDVDYNRYWLGIAMSAVCLMSVLRVPYQLVVEAAGRFKEMRNGAYLEIVLNVFISILCAIFLGIIGLLVGSFMAALVRTTQYAWYSQVKILNKTVWSTIKNYFIYFLTGTLLVFLSTKLIGIEVNSYQQWAFVAIVVFFVVTVTVLILGLAFNYKQFMSVIDSLFARRKI